MADNEYLTARVDQHEARIEKLDHRVGILERDGAVTNERMSTIQSSLNEIKTAIRDSNSGIRRVLLWAAAAIAGPMISAIVVFILKGGLHV